MVKCVEYGVNDCVQGMFIGLCVECNHKEVRRMVKELERE